MKHTVDGLTYQRSTPDGILTIDVDPSFRSMRPYPLRELLMSVCDTIQGGKIGSPTMDDLELCGSFHAAISILTPFQGITP